MTKYYYVARSPTGKKEKGYLQVENENELIDIMLKHNYYSVTFFLTHSSFTSSSHKIKI